MLGIVTRLRTPGQFSRAVWSARKRYAYVRRTIHSARHIVKALLSTRHPVLAHLIPMRRCNLSCTYCNEYDQVSEPVPLETMCRRIDKLHELGTSIVVFSGGEPLMHKQMEQIIAHARRRGMVVGLLTNGYLLTRKRIEALNKAGLEYLQISIDNVMPDDVSKKSLKVLDQKLVLLSRFALFGVNINSVIGGEIDHPEDAIVVARRATELGFTISLGVIHDGDGQLKPLKDLEQQVYRVVRKMGKRTYGPTTGFKDRVARGEPNEWRCRAGARYLYIDEDGDVNYCSQQRGYPGIPLERYTHEDIRREYFSKKSCASYCTIYCVHAVGVLDNWRDPQKLKANVQIPSGAGVRQSD